MVFFVAKTGILIIFASSELSYVRVCVCEREREREREREKEREREREREMSTYRLIAKTLSHHSYSQLLAQ